MRVELGLTMMQWNSNMLRSGKSGSTHLSPILLLTHSLSTSESHLMRESLQNLTCYGPLGQSDTGSSQ